MLRGEVALSSEDLAALDLSFKHEEMVLGKSESIDLRKAPRRRFCIHSRMLYRWVISLFFQIQSLTCTPFYTFPKLCATILLP